METGTDKVEVKRDGHRADVLISRPEKRNAMDHDVIEGLRNAFEKLGDEDDVRAITLLGEGDVFCAGMDLEMMAGFTQDEGEPTADVHTLFDTIQEIPKPVVAGIKRAAIAGGFELTLPADFRIMGEEAKYGAVEVDLGIFPSGGSTQRLPRLVGLAAAKEIVLMGEYIEPEEARRMGLVNEVCADDDVDERAREMADELTKKAPLGVERAIEALNHAGDVPLEDGLRIEQYLAKDLYDTKDAQEGFAARMEGREPEFERE
ncbi:MAG: enoyl-CoA hydratase/isomerase family protein [Halobacteriales archaeon]|nr:enoyl-CoA hydratase/isomerase family protein [Halobacteriales archaeon]